MNEYLEIGYTGVLCVLSVIGFCYIVAVVFYGYGKVDDSTRCIESRIRGSIGAPPTTIRVSSKPPMKRTKIDIEVPEPEKEPIDYMVIMGAEPYSVLVWKQELIAGGCSVSISRESPMTRHKL